MSMTCGHDSESKTHKLSVKAFVLFGADLGEQIGVEGKLPIIWEDDIRLEIP